MGNGQAPGGGREPWEGAEHQRRGEAQEVDLAKLDEEHRLTRGHMEALLERNEGARTQRWNALRAEGFTLEDTTWKRGQKALENECLVSWFLRAFREGHRWRPVFSAI